MRELSNLIERSVALSQGDVIQLADLPAKIVDGGRPPLALGAEEFPDEGLNLDSVLSQVEKRWLVSALDEAKGNKTEAAQLLHMSFRSFRYRLAKYGLDELDTD